MLAVLFVGLLIMPLSALFFGALFLKNLLRFESLKPFLLSGLVALVFDFFRFYSIYKNSLQQAQYATSASQLGIFSILSSVFVLAVGILVSALLFSYNKWKSSSQSETPLSNFFWGAQVFISVLVISFQFFYHSKNQQRIELVSKASQLVRPEVTQDVLQAFREKNDLVPLQALLANPQCPTELLVEFSQSELMPLRSAVLDNPQISFEIVEKLASDSNEAIRFQVAKNPKATIEMLEKLLKDPSKLVREKAEKELALRKSKN